MKYFLIFLNIFNLATLATVPGTNLRFLEKTNVETNVNGVNHYDINGMVRNDANTESNQNVQVFKAGNEIELVNWTVVNASTGKPVLRDIRKIAQDFEDKNPNYEVIAGVNGDYFSGESINANIVFGAKTYKSKNHTKYLSVLFNKNGSFVDLIKSNKASSKYMAYLYDKDSRSLLKVVELSKMNQSTLADGETSFYYNYNGVNPLMGTHFSLDIDAYTFTDNLMHFSLDNAVKKTGTITNSSTNVSILSKNEEVNTLLNLNPIVKIQTISEANEDEMMIGVGSHIIRDGVIPAFEAIGDQGLDFSKARHPRTGFGFTEDNKPVLLTVDGRSAGGSVGVNLREFATIMKSQGVVNGFNLDGGGSTQAVLKVNGKFEMVNTPSEGNITQGYRGVINGLFFVRPKQKAIVTYELNDDELTVSINNQAIASENYLIIDGKKTALKENVFKTKIDLTKDISISVETLGSNKMMLSNYVIYKSKEKPIEKPSYTYAYEIDDKDIEFNINYDDPKKIITRMYIIHEETQNKKNAIIQNSNNRKAIFIEVLTEGINNFTIYTEYSDKSINEEKVVVDLSKDSLNGNSNLSKIIIIASIALGVGLITTVILTALRKGKK